MAVFPDEGGGGGGGGGGPTLYWNQTPFGGIDGSNRTFVLANTPNPSNAVMLFLNGLLQTPGIDYTISGATISIISTLAPQLGDILLVTYQV